ncbi:hypothetical protein [Micromonospora sp. LOL_023]|uniref:hypothetical protein n=1 Tax=Micromonospora sp. LOL_023 TaxID=3345418 RepID=UPI003A8668AA
MAATRTQSSRIHPSGTSARRAAAPDARGGRFDRGPLPACAPTATVLGLDLEPVPGAANAARELPAQASLRRNISQRLPVRDGNLVWAVLEPADHPREGF